SSAGCRGRGHGGGRGGENRLRRAKTVLGIIEELFGDDPAPRQLLRASIVHVCIRKVRLSAFHIGTMRVFHVLLRFRRGSRLGDILRTIPAQHLFVVCFRLFVFASCRQETRI